MAADLSLWVPCPVDDFSTSRLTIEQTFGMVVGADFPDLILH